ncbi:protein-L-isoaspartate O-methyltransferase [Candidatus Koribacter versatilis Ellin345]|uniref:Protein-L-isoaspartate O-methyltransferase n=1 Tax=Koribacter versatilis (strain Ellin345) TaxID=204669 RepID=PIMT_KORVE|nr:protein-L-isoaspartate(D-aspartate) O-methyltransferase [Candidatus Koribacter versatilis]Q1INS6.1 RecName: Full=Protein-L-isoaspartate O-methyltransferase; AltName: Full=L-isoaspartyl protein carboxyl methyltransferase; AltName: Full=Protein L-isoaspartyl methyltransferase; AltName: Full=Protein-beta-aspartate methyltransferase; Short=PIMT [Candidatus Koribacter versatilis Ellin345]ABF41474.1 protein-L-isoaspartate O-methyltransferase [Candidatus Koribacter versatilis Ellin345]
MAASPDLTGFALDRARMIDTQLRQRGIRDERVLNAMATIPREEFVVARYHPDAYADHPLPIPLGQTISQPYIVARMLEAAQIAPADKVLEVGTGTGYQAALLGALAAQVFTIERHAELAALARIHLEHLGYTNISVITGDGSEGLADQAPFDVILVAAAVPDFPPALFHQLAEGGRMVIPVGSPELQALYVVRKQAGRLQRTKLDDCRFVPLIGNQGYSPAR